MFCLGPIPWQKPLQDYNIKGFLRHGIDQNCIYLSYLKYFPLHLLSVSRLSPSETSNLGRLKISSEIVTQIPKSSTILVV